MKKLVLFLAVSILISGLALAQYAPPGGSDITYGKLTVYSDVVGTDIYVDAKFVGQDRATISNIPTGKHYVRVAKKEETIQSGIVTVKEGEETIVVAKQTEEQLLEKRRRPNHVLVFGCMTSVGYNEVNPSGTYNLSYRPQYGVGTEVKFALPLANINVDLGFFLNYPSLVVSTTGNAQMAISSPYICVSREFLKLGPMKVNVGAGLNYGIFNPGGGTAISIASRPGYLAYLEGLRLLEDGQKLLIKFGYITYIGKSSLTINNVPQQGDVTSSGFFLQAGIAYQL